ncbi:MAG: hypothetical protein JWM30_2001 [Burkholderia sp.]|nr:hypothetical protein [Burkholderia sp.]
MREQTMIRPIAKVLLNSMPGIRTLLKRKQGGDTGSALYCYGVWLKHLTLLAKNGVQLPPKSVAELGPGTSMGTGLAAMLCGADTYYALDVVDYSNAPLNLRILDELVALFRQRAPRPTRGWPCFDQYLGPDLFPRHILTDDVLAASLADSRIARIRKALEHGGEYDGITIRYIAPWSMATSLPSAVDLVLSHSVLQYVPDLDQVYRTLSSWLRPNAMMSHQIDFGSMGLSSKWNGYRSCPEPVWKLLSRNASHIINRQPHSVHVRLLAMQGLNILENQKDFRDDGIQRSQLARAWKNLSDDDLNCSGAFIQAQKNGSNQLAA